MSRPEVRRLLLVAAAAFTIFVVVWVLAVGTELGQKADDAALTGGRSAPDTAQSAADELLRFVSVGSLVAATAVLSALAWLRRRPGLLLVPAAVVGLSLIATELFKLVIFERPDLIVDSNHPENSYPSGHTTVAISIGLAAIIVAPERLRGAVGVAAALLAGAGGVFVVTADWHRPSDPIGSFTLTLAVAALVVAVLRMRTQARAGGPAETRQSPDGGERRPHAARVEITTLMAGAALFVGSGVIASLRYGSEVDWNRFHAAFLVAAVVIVVAAGLTVGALLRGLASPEPRHDDDLG